MNPSTFPSDEFNFEFYRLNNNDLIDFNHDQLFDHYTRYGIKEGRICTNINSREKFLNLLQGKGAVLEIGVFDRPSLEFLRITGSTVHYADWLSREELIARAEKLPDRESEKVPEIEYSLKFGYEQIKNKYDAVVSHHCLEHQADLIGHFIDINSILVDGGWYLFSIPNKMNCFDHFIPETNIVDVLESYYLKRKSPSFKSILEHRCFTQHDFINGVNPYDCEDHNITQSFKAAFDEFTRSDYVDVHCWQFTPSSFKKIYSQIVSLGLLPKYKCIQVYPCGSEFYVAIEF